MQLWKWTCTIFCLLTLSCLQRRAIEYSAVAGSQQNGVSHISGYCLLGKMSDDMPANDKITAHQDNEFMKCRSFHCSKLDDRHLYLFQWGLFMYQVRRIWNWVAPWTRHQAAFSGWIPPWCRSWCCPSAPVDVDDDVDDDVGDIDDDVDVDVDDDVDDHNQHLLALLLHHTVVSSTSSKASRSSLGLRFFRFFSLSSIWLWLRWSRSWS